MKNNRIFSITTWERGRGANKRRWPRSRVIASHYKQVCSTWGTPSRRGGNFPKPTLPSSLVSIRSHCPALPAVSGSAGGLGAPMAQGSIAHHTKRGSPLSNGSFSIDLDRTVIISLALDVVKLFSKTPNFEQIKAVIKLIQGLQTPKTNSSSVDAARPFKAYFCSLMKRQSNVHCQC